MTNQERVRRAAITAAAMFQAAAVLLQGRRDCDQARCLTKDGAAKEWQMHLEQIRIDAAECRFLSTQAAIGKRELLTRLAENLNALALDVEEAMATNNQQATRSRQMSSWLLVVVLAAIAGAAFFWVNNRAEKDASSVATMQSKPEPSPAPQDSRDQATVLLSNDQGERKVLTEQLGALAARVDTLERALANLERARAEIVGRSNKQSVGSGENHTAAETKPSAPEEKPVRTEEKRISTLEKPAAAEENADVKQTDGVPSGTGNPFIEPVEENHTAAETKPSAPEEKPVRTEEKRISTLEKPAAAEENADAKQTDGVPSGTGNPFVEPVDQVGATPVPKQAELNPRKPALSLHPAARTSGLSIRSPGSARASTDGGTSAGSAIGWMNKRRSVSPSTTSGTRSPSPAAAGLLGR
jgi:hypothetical protein